MRRASILLALGLAASLEARATVLPVPLVQQEQDQWCWAAVSSALLGYYGQSVKQCTIAEWTRTQATWHSFGTVDCCVSAASGCNYWNYDFGAPGSISAILSHWGVANSGVGSTLTQSQVQAEIAAGRPFVLRWAWPTGDGHFVVGHGLSGSTMSYMDPWQGEGHKTGSYAWVASGSDSAGNHSWKGTTLMLVAPAAAAKPDQSPVTLDRSPPRDLASLPPDAGLPPAPRADLAAPPPAPAQAQPAVPSQAEPETGEAATVLGGCAVGGSPGASGAWLVVLLVLGARRCAARCGCRYRSGSHSAIVSTASWQRPRQLQRSSLLYFQVSSREPPPPRVVTRKSGSRRPNASARSTSSFLSPRDGSTGTQP
jgi:hypothetical protein